MDIIAHLAIIMIVLRQLNVHGGCSHQTSLNSIYGGMYVLLCKQLSLRFPVTQMAIAQSAAQDDLTAQNLHHYRILVVDDNANCAKIMMWTLEALGHTVKTAHEGQAAISLAISFLPDIVFLDIGLPNMNGYEICQAMRSEPTLRNTLFVAQTGWGQKEHHERSKIAGFHYHLVKPVSIEALKNILLILDQKRALPEVLDLAS